jgi:chromosome segregation ATPase
VEDLKREISSQSPSDGPNPSKAEFEACVIQNKQLTEELDEVKAQRNDDQRMLMSQVSQWQNACQEERDKTKTLELKVSLLEKEVQQISQTKLEKESLTKDMKALEEGLKEKGAGIAGLREQLAALNAQLLQKDTQLQTQMQAKESLSEELARSKEEISRLQQTQVEEDMNDSGITSQLKELAHELACLKDDYQNKEHALANLEKDMSTAEMELQEKDRVVSELEDHVKRLEEDAESVVLDKDRLVAAFEAQIAQLMVQQGRSIEEGQGGLGAAGEGNTTNSEAGQEGLKSELIRMKDLLEERAAKIAELKSALSTASEMEDQTVSGLEERLAKAALEIERTNLLVNAKDLEIAEMTKSLTFSLETVSGLESKLEHTVSEVETIQKELKERDAKMSEMALSLSAAKTANQTLLNEKDAHIVKLEEALSSAKAHANPGTRSHRICGDFCHLKLRF